MQISRYTITKKHDDDDDDGDATLFCSYYESMYSFFESLINIYSHSFLDVDKKRLMGTVNKFKDVTLLNIYNRLSRMDIAGDKVLSSESVDFVLFVERTFVVNILFKAYFIERK